MQPHALYIASLLRHQRKKEEPRHKEKKPRPVKTHQNPAHHYHILSYPTPLIHVSRPVILPVRRRCLGHAVRSWSRCRIVALLCSGRRGVHGLRCGRTPSTSPSGSRCGSCRGSRGVVWRWRRGRVGTWRGRIHSRRRRSRCVAARCRCVVGAGAPAVRRWLILPAVVGWLWLIGGCFSSPGITTVPRSLRACCEPI